jgi:hypothetical protein
MARRLILLGWGGVLLGALAFYGLVLRPMQLAMIHRASAFGGTAAADGRTRAVARQHAAVSALDRERIRLTLARTRLDVEEALAARPSGDTVTLAVRVVAEEWKDAPRSATLRAATRAAWEELGLATTKVAVGVVVLDRTTMRQWGRALALGPVDPVAFYIPPDSLTPATCVAVVVAPRLDRTQDPRALQTAGASWLGPCAFEARFGIPGRAVRRWLANRRFDVAMAPDWIEGGTRPELLLPWLSLTTRSRDWYWTRQYLVPAQTATCAAGRPASCIAALRAGDREARVPPSGVIARSDARWMLGEGLTGGEYFLGAVLRTSGERKFRELWRTSLPIDSALTLALGAPAGEWTAEWQATVATPPRFGPLPGVLEPLGALLLAALAVATTARNVRRREVG